MGPRAERPLGSGMSHRGVQAAPGGQRPRRWAERARTAQEPGAQGAGRGKCAASRVPFSQWPSGTRLTSSGTLGGRPSRRRLPEYPALLSVARRVTHVVSWGANVSSSLSSAG